MPKKTRTARVSAQVKAKAKKPSTYAALAGLAAGLAPLFPQYAAAISAAGLVLGTVGTLMPAMNAGQAEAP